MPGWDLAGGRAGVQLLGGLQVGGVNGTACYRIVAGTVAIDPASINATTTGAPTFTLTGAKAGDVVLMVPPAALEDDLVPKGARVTADNTVTLYLYNGSGGAVDGASLTWTYLWFKFNE